MQRKNPRNFFQDTPIAGLKFLERGRGVLCVTTATLTDFARVIGCLQGCQVGFFEANLAFFKMFGLGNFENLLSNWPFFKSMLI